MNILIIYATKYGCTQKCAELLSKKLTGKVDLCNLKTEKVPELLQYDKVIIGGSVYMGKAQKEVSQFCSKNLQALKDKKVGLFICAMREGDMVETELKDSFPEELLARAVTKESFGGEFIIKKMSVIDRLIVKKVSKIDKDTSNILEENIDRFAKLMNNA